MAATAELPIPMPKIARKRQIRDFYQGGHFLSDGETSPMPYHQCHFCKRILGTEQGLASHYESFHKEVTCAVCPGGGLVCANKPEWRTHMARVHPELLLDTADVFPCDVCKRVLTSEANLAAHKRSFHELVPCPMCGTGVVGMNRRRHMVKYHLKKPEDRERLMAKKERERQKILERQLKRLEQKAIKKRQSEEKLKLKALRRRQRLERALLKENLAALNRGRAPMPSPSDFRVNLRQNVVSVPMHFPISEVWYSPASAHEVPLAALDDDSSLAFDPFVVEHCQMFVKQIFDGPDAFASDNDGSSFQLEFVDEVEVVTEEEEEMDEMDARGVVFESLMLWSEGEIAVVAEEVVVENIPEGENGRGKIVTQRCSGCGQTFFLDLDFQLHGCGPAASHQDEDGGALVLPIEQELKSWEQTSKFGI